jgi:hypothetical protein
MNVLVYYCPECDVTVEGEFVPQAVPLQRLSDEQRNFLLTFVACEGKLNRMEKVYGLSYLTLRNRLMELIQALDYTPKHV